MSDASQDDQRLAIRRPTEAELPDFSELVASAFLIDHNADFLAEERGVFDPARAHVVCDGPAMIGCGQLVGRRMAVPGPEPVPVAAVTSVGVAPGHRRRGVLSMIMHTQLATLHETGEPVAALWASEGGIYGRFGYGLATQHARLAIPRGTAFRRDVAIDPAPVRELPRAHALPLIRAIYDKVWHTRVGHMDRTDAGWDYHLIDGEMKRAGQTAYRFAVHPEGYAVYRTKQEWQDRGPRSPVIVHALVAANPAAYAAICRYLLDIDLVGKVTVPLAVDAPLVHMLADPRAAVRTVFDGLWVRLVDVDRAMAARRFTGPLDVVLDVADEPCPWNAGRWRLVVAPDGRAEVMRTDAPADLALNVDVLGAAYLGGTRLSTLADAGRVHEHRPGAVARTSVAFLHEQEPSCLESF